MSRRRPGRQIPGRPACCSAKSPITGSLKCLPWKPWINRMIQPMKKANRTMPSSAPMGPGHVRPDHRDQGPQHPVGDRLHGVEADLWALVDQEEDQAGEPGQHIGQARGDVLGHAAAGRLVLAAPVAAGTPARLLPVRGRLLPVLARLLAPSLVAGGGGGAGVGSSWGQAPRCRPGAARAAARPATPSEGPAPARPAWCRPGGSRGAAGRRAHPARQGAHASARSAGRVGSAPRSWSSSCRLAQLTRTGEPIYTHPNRWSWNAQLAAARHPGHPVAFVGAGTPAIEPAAPAARAP
jgi:hypothetical protein